MILALLLTIYSTISIDYTNYNVSKLTNFDFNDTKRTPNLIKIENNEVFIPSKSDISTIFYPLEFIETNKMLEIEDINGSEKVKEKNYFQTNTKNNISILNKFETKLSAGEINFLFINKFLENHKKDNLMVSIRDYYDNDAIGELSKAFLFDNTKVTFIPSSLSYIIEESASLNTNFSKLVINMLGNKTVFNLFTVEYLDNKINKIKLLKTDVIDLISDNCIEKIIFDNIYDTLKSQPNFTDDVKGFMNVEDIKNQIKDNLRSQVSKYEHLECFGQKEDGSVILFSNIVFDLLKIRDEINLKSIEIKEHIKEFYYNFVQDENKEQFKFDSIAIITTLGSELVKDFFSLDNLINIQLQNIVRGGLKYFKIHDKIEDLRIVKNTGTEISHANMFLNELKTYREYLRLKNLEIDFDELNENDLSLLEKESKSLAEKQKFLSDFYKLKNKNEQIKKYKAIREKKVKEMGDYLVNLEKILKNDVKLYESGLKKKFDDMSKWYEENKDNKEILGNVFEEKRDNLEGLAQVYKTIVNRKKEEKKNEMVKEEPLDEKDINEDKKEVLDEEIPYNDENNSDESVNDSLESEELLEDKKNFEDPILDKANDKPAGKVKTDAEKQKQLEEENKKFMEAMGEEFGNEKFDKNKMDEMQKQLQEMMKDGKYNDLFKNGNFDMFKEKEEEKDL